MGIDFPLERCFAEIDAISDNIFIQENLGKLGKIKDLKLRQK